MTKLVRKEVQASSPIWPCSCFGLDMNDFDHAHALQLLLLLLLLLLVDVALVFGPLVFVAVPVSTFFWSVVVFCFAGSCDFDGHVLDICVSPILLGWQTSKVSNALQDPITTSKPQASD